MKYFSTIIATFLISIHSVYGHIEHTKQDLLKCFCFNKNKVISIYVAKNASTTISYLFNEMPIHHVYASLPPGIKNHYTKILVVRDPYTRAISSYLEIMKLRSDGPENTTRSLPFYQNRANRRLSFKQFLETVEDNFYDQHAQPQWAYLYPKELTLQDIDFIICFEHLYEDLEVFSKRYQIPIKRNLRLNEGFSSVKKELEKYVEEDEEIRALIRRVYAEDFIFYEEGMKKREEILRELS